MAYATPQDLIDRFGLSELKRMAPATGPEGYDVTRVGQVLDDASAELDTYLGTRYPVPLASPPPLLVKFCADLAREALDQQGRAPVLEAAKRARAWARDVGQGKANLGLPEDGGDGEPAPAPSGGILVDAPERVFTDETLGSFLR